MDRRTFLGALGLAALSPWVPAHAATRPPLLLLIELNGGPDTLQMVIPRTADYRSARPKLAVPDDQIATLDERTGLNRRMSALMPAWQAKDLAVVRGVGYSPPNRSHFRSIEIWNQAGPALHDDAWIPRLLAKQRGVVRRNGLVNAIDGLVLGGEPGPLAGANARTVVIHRLDRFLKQAAKIPDGVVEPVENPALAHILEVRGRVDAAAADFEKRLAAAPRLKGEFPRGGLGVQLTIAARLIAAGAPVRVIKVQQGGYDTHAGQPNKLNRLMSELADGLAALREALVGTGDWDRTLVMTYAEFGRRMRENGSRGTDHGTAASHLVAGGRVKGGLYGAMPSLTALEGGDLKHHVDFRSIYADAAAFLGVRSSEVLGGVRPLGLI